MGDTPTRCIECGGLTGALNEDEDGVPCPACAERLLETLPGVFHTPWAQPAGEAGEEAAADAARPEFADGDVERFEGIGGDDDSVA